MVGATSTESAHIPPSELGPRDVQGDLLPTLVYTSSPGLAIPENGCPDYVTDTIYVPDSLTIEDLEVGLNIATTYRGDLNISLRSPAGTVVQLATSRWDGDNNYDLMLDDQSTNPIDDDDSDDISPPYYDRDAAPVGSLSDFVGENAQGTWTLQICDDFNQDLSLIHI